MANAFSKEEVVLFELLLEKFDPNNITAKQVMKFRPEMTQQERAGYTVWRPIPYVSTTIDGLDISGQFKDLTQLSVPSTIDVIANVPWSLTAQDLNDPLQRERKAESASQALSARVDNAIATLIANQGSLVVTRAGAAAGYADIAAVEARMLEEDINIGMNRSMILNGTDWQGMSGDLANRETMTGKPTTAYERSFVGPVAGFDTFRTSFNPTLLTETGATITTAGVQSHVPLATSTNAINGGESNVDNRYFTLVVDTTTGVNPGDAFTIPTVFAVSMIHKNVTPTLRTFRVISITDATDMVITPAPVFGAGGTQAELEYANVSAAIPDATVLTFINIATVPTNTFWTGDSVEVIEGKLATPAGDFAGVSSMRASTDSGVEILFAKGGDVGRLAADYRLTIFFGVTDLQPQMNGILLFNQT